MKISSIVYPVFNPYEKSACEIFVSGCTRHCKRCHNPELQDFNAGDELELSSFTARLKRAEKFFDIISITGGDLLCQDEKEAEDFTIKLKDNFPDKDFWLYTGAIKRNIPRWVWELFNHVKVGPYILSKHREGFPASSNQRLYKKINGRWKDITREVINEY